jgi:hypothetical protein
MNPLLSDLCSKHRTESVPPKSYHLMANVNATFKQQFLNLAQRKRVPGVKHHREADDLGELLK